MKILYLSNHRFPTEKANGLQMAKMCEALIEEGSDLLFLGPKRKQSSYVGTKKAQDFYTLRRPVPQVVLPCLDTLQSRWVPGIVAYFLQSGSFALQLWLHRKKWLRERVIITRSVLSMLTLSSKDAWFFEAHTFPKTRLGQWFQKWRLAKSRGLVVISRGLEKKYSKLLGQKKMPIHLAPDGVDLGLFQTKITREEARSKLKLPDGKSMVLYTGSPYSWKGVYTLAEAARGGQFRSYLTVFVGGNANEPEFMQLKKTAPHCLVLPFVPHTQVPLYLAAADVLVLPNSAKDSISREDTSPLKLFEALASGREIVASRVPALEEILSDREATFFQADDAEDLRRVLQNVLQSSEKKGLAAIHLAQNYSWQTRARNLLKFFRQNCKLP